jgi:YHS domain-containing protein
LPTGRERTARAARARPFYSCRNEPMAKATDPVCKRVIEEEKAAGHSEHQGRKYFFCSKMCKQKFDQDPDRYTAGQ